MTTSKKHRPILRAWGLGLSRIFVAPALAVLHLAGHLDAEDWKKHEAKYRKDLHEAFHGK